MTIRIASTSVNLENKSADELRDKLLADSPELAHPDLHLEIIPGLLLPGAEIDLVVMFEDRRDAKEHFTTSKGLKVRSFVLIVEVKRHSADLVKFSGSKVEVRYGERWHDASSQCDRQMYALKTYQRASLKGSGRRDSTFLQRAIWFPRIPKRAFSDPLLPSSVSVHFAEVSWGDILDGLQVPDPSRLPTRIAAFAPAPHPRQHDFSSMRELLTHQILPTRLDLRRINTLTQTRFDAEKTNYIRKLGDGLLLLRGRGGTGKTFSLVQIALHLARTGKRTILLTYNHGLIADINRSLSLIAKREPTLSPIPTLQTRYSFMQDVFTRVLGDDAEKAARQIPDLADRELHRELALANHDGPLSCDFDFILIDEGQDWSEAQRDLVFRMVGPGRVVVADGVDQFVDQFRCDWDRGDVEINRRHTLRASRRTKGATCQTIGDVAKKLGIADWDLEPDPEAFGGRFTVIVGATAPEAIERGMGLLAHERQLTKSLRPVDDLVCLPSSSMAKGINFPVLLERWAAARKAEIWRGYDKEDRRVYPLEQSQIRAIQYASCRGMEGWSTLCLGLDLFFDFHCNKPQIDKQALEDKLRKDLGFFFSSESVEEQYRQAAWSYAVNWLMIPLTRSIDHLIIHLTSKNSQLGEILTDVSDKNPGAIEWLH